MRFKEQTVVNVFLVLSFFLYSSNALASFSIECEGLITIKSDLLSLSDKNNSIKATIQAHNHTFICTGHSKKIGKKGNRDFAEIVLPSTINKTSLRKGINLQAKMKYKTWRGKGGGRSTTWTALKIVETIPPKKVPIKPKQSPRIQIPKSPAEGTDFFVEESLWAKNKSTQTSCYKDLTRVYDANEVISECKVLFEIYHGDLFNIIYPKSFKAKPLKPLERIDVNAHRNEELEIEPKLPPKYFEYVKTNEAFFTSPDGLVEFSIYAIDGTDVPSYFRQIAENELNLSFKSKKYLYPEEHLNYMMKSWVTIKAKDNSYYRSYSYQRACHDGDSKFDWNDCETQVFSIKYSNTEAYNEYRDLFIAFNQSLVRTAEY